MRNVIKPTKEEALYYTKELGCLAGDIPIEHINWAIMHHSQEDKLCSGFVDLKTAGIFYNALIKEFGIKG